ncbi:MAG: hypothetical protein RJB58_2325 [Pseudomonadota bacterium]|jgi:uncharacterized SAM-binding protein YcdF (DUF218 family)
MFFWLSKLVWMVITPSSLLLLLAAAGLVCLLLRWRVAARSLGLAAGVLFLLIGILPFQDVLLRALENQYPRAGWPARVDGVLILSGGLDWKVLQSRGVPAMELSRGRVVGGFEVARRYPGAKVIFAGGSGALGAAAMSEAEGTRYIFAQMGLDEKRLILEQRSRNTYENILFARDFAKPKAGEVWLLATTASHMPRAMGVARKLGWAMQPWPTDYVTTPTGINGFFEYARNLNRMDMAMHEWLGLILYQSTGRSARS